LTLVINGTIAFFLIQVSTYHSRIKNLTGIFIFQFMQATLGTTITERFPLFRGHLGDGFAFPEWTRFLTGNNRLLKNLID